MNTDLIIYYSIFCYFSLTFSCVFLYFNFIFANKDLVDHSSYLLLQLQLFSISCPDGRLIDQLFKTVNIYNSFTIRFVLFLSFILFLVHYDQCLRINLEQYANDITLLHKWLHYRVSSPAIANNTTHKIIQTLIPNYYTFLGWVKFIYTTKKCTWYPFQNNRANSMCSFWNT